MSRSTSIHVGSTAPVGIPALEVFQRDGAAELWSAARSRRCRPGTAILQQGTAWWSVPLVLSGMVRLSQVGDAGEVHTLGLAGPGECPLILDALLDQLPRVSIVALGECVIAQIPVVTLREVAARRPEVWRELAGRAATQRWQALDFAASLRAPTVPRRLAATLLLLNKRYADANGTLPAEITRAELARLAGTSPETVVRQIGRWADEDLISKRGRALAVIDRAGLARQASPAVET
jgi:CRP-like cAMP-binding protein